jgi:hypothetical protein
MGSYAYRLYVDVNSITASGRAVIPIEAHNGIDGRLEKWNT